MADIAYEVVPGFLPVSTIVEIVKDKYPNMAKTEIVLAYNTGVEAGQGGHVPPPPHFLIGGGGQWYVCTPHF